MLIESDCSPSGLTIRPDTPREKLLAEKWAARRARTNRRNAKHSTGPRTDDGKNRSKMNALKHGLFADDAIVLPTESQADHDQLRDEIHHAVQPTDAIEVALAERMVAARWKMRRLRATEARFHEKGARGVIQRREHAFLHRAGCGLLSRKQAAQEKLESEAREKTDWLTVAPAVLMCGNFSDWQLLDLHEQRLENAFARALRELRQWRREKRLAQKEASETAFEDEVEDEAAATSAKSQNEPTAPQSHTTNANSETCEQGVAQTVIPITTFDLLKSVKEPHLAPPLAARDPDPPGGGA